VTVCGVIVSCLFAPSSEAPPDLSDTSVRVVRGRHLVYAIVGWGCAFGWLALITFDDSLGRFRPRNDHPIAAPLAGTTSAWLASYSLSMFKIVMTAIRNAWSSDWSVRLV
jgi:hypothetical protein